MIKMCAYIDYPNLLGVLKACMGNRKQMLYM